LIEFPNNLKAFLNWFETKQSLSWPFEVVISGFFSGRNFVQTEIFGTFAYNEPIRESVKFRENVWRRQNDPGISAFYFFPLPGDSQATTSLASFDFNRNPAHIFQSRMEVDV
jgi:hypothetical protein